MTLVALVVGCVAGVVIAFVWDESGRDDHDEHEEHGK